MEWAVLKEMFNQLNYEVNHKLLRTFIMLLLFHVILSVTLFGIANSDFLTNLHNGSGFWHFAADSILYHKEALYTLNFLEKSEWSYWWYAYQGHAHVKFISLTYWLTGIQNQLIFQIVNGPIWAGSVLLIYRSAQLLFKGNIFVPTVSILFFFQPSVLMHSSQLLRDPFVLFGVCSLCYGWISISQKKINLLAIFFIGLGVFFVISMKPYLAELMVIIFTIYLIYAFFNREISLINILILLFVLIFSILDAHPTKKARVFYSTEESIDINNKTDLSQNLKSYTNSLIVNSDKQLLSGSELIKDTNKINEIFNQISQKSNPIISNTTPLNEVTQLAKTNQKDELNITTLQIEDTQEDTQLAKTNQKDLSSTSDIFLSNLIGIKEKYNKGIESRLMRPMELQEISLIEQYLVTISIYEKSLIDYIALNGQKKKLDELKEIIFDTKKLLRDRSDFLIENEEKWQKKNALSKFLDLSSWRLLEFRNSFKDNIGISGSAIDPFLVFHSFNDAVMYFPRAVQISFLSPFPSHWLQEGMTTGRIGRIISGFEMIMMYAVLIGFIYAFLTHFKKIRPLMPVIIFSSAIIILVGYVMPNVGTIFRFRMVTIIPFVIAGSYGISLIIGKFKKNKNY